MGKKNKDKPKEKDQEIPTTGTSAIKKFFSKFSKKNAKSRDTNTTCRDESPSSKSRGDTKDDKNIPVATHSTEKNLTGLPQSVRKRSSQKESGVGDESPSDRTVLKTTQSAEHLDQPRLFLAQPGRHLVKESKDRSERGSDEFIQRLKNLSGSNNRERCEQPTASHRRRLSSDSVLCRAESDLSLPPSPTHSDTTWDSTSSARRRLYPASTPSRQCSSETRLPRRTSSGSRSSIDKDILKEKRRERQKYHELKHKQPSNRLENDVNNHGIINFSQSPTRSTSVKSNLSSINTSRIISMPSNPPGCVKTADANMEDDIHILPQNTGQHHGVASPHINSVVRIDHVDSVSLQSFSPSSTLERQKSRDKSSRVDPEDEMDSNSAPMIHYHLTIQNCDGINIYMNNPSGGDLSPSAVQVDEAGLLKRLNWVQGPTGKESVSLESLPKQSSSNSNNSQSSRQSLLFSDTAENLNRSQVQYSNNHRSSARTSDKKYDADKSPKSHSVKPVGVSPTTKTPDKVSSFPWHRNSEAASQHGSVSASRYQSFTSPTSSCSTASQTSQSQSTQSMQTDGEITSNGNSNVQKEMKTCSVNHASQTVNTKSRVSNSVVSEQTAPKAKFRPIAHVSPNRRSVQRTQNNQHRTGVASVQPIQSVSSAPQSNTTGNYHNGRIISARAQSPVIQPHVHFDDQANGFASLSSSSSASLSSLTTEGLLDADANGDVTSSSDQDTTLGDESFSSSDSASSVVERPNTADTRMSRRDQPSQHLSRPALAQQQITRGVSAERYTGTAASTLSSDGQDNSAFRRIQSMREAGRRGGGDAVPPHYVGLRRELARVPGVLMVAYRQNRLIVYLSRDRRNVEGVVRFMIAHDVHQHQYDCQVMPYRTNTGAVTRPPPADTLVQAR